MYVIDNVNDDFVTCENEQQFKKLYCAMKINKSYRAKIGDVQKTFCIETEETVAGFPDVMELVTVNTGGGMITYAKFYEFKISDKNGNIKFQPTQPAFYKQNDELNIKVVAYNRFSKRVHLFRARDIFDNTSPYNTTNGKINLNEVERSTGV